MSDVDLTKADGDAVAAEDAETVTQDSASSRDARPAAFLRAGLADARDLMKGWPDLLRATFTMVPDVLAGSFVLVRHCWGWVFVAGEWLPRALLALIGGVFGYAVYRHHPELVVWAGGTMWSLTALWVSPRTVKWRAHQQELRAERKAAQEKEQAELKAAREKQRAEARAARRNVATAPVPAGPQEAGGGGPHRPATQREAFEDLVWSYLHRSPHKVHLSTLVKHLHADGARAWDVTSVREQYEAYEYRVAPQVWIDGVNRAGIKRDEQHRQRVFTEDHNEGVA